MSFIAYNLTNPENMARGMLQGWHFFQLFWNIKQKKFNVVHGIKRDTEIQHDKQGDVAFFHIE